jgi:glutathionylspermidine synthase
MTVPNQAAPAAAPAAAPIQPQEIQSNDEAIGSLARGFLADLETNQDPNHPNEAQAPVEDAPPEEAPPEVPEPEAETPAEPEVPLVEVDIDGEKYSIPEKVKHRVMADKDYRQKTMEVAAQRKQLEQHQATAQKLVEQAQQLAPYHAKLFQMDAHADHLSKLLQSPELATDPLQFNRVQGELAILLRNRDQFAQGLQQHVNQLDGERAKLRTEKFVQEVPELLKEFPDLAKPESRERLAKYVNEAGLPPEAIDFINYSAASAKLAWKANLYDQMVADQAKAKAKLAEKVKTLPAAQTGRAADKSAKDKSLQERWQKGGGKINDPAFTELLRSKLRS